MRLKQAGKYHTIESLPRCHSADIAKSCKDNTERKDRLVLVIYRGRQYILYTYRHQFVMVPVIYHSLETIINIVLVS